MVPAEHRLAIDDEVPRNRRVHLFSLTLTKIADGLIDPKLVLAWLLGAGGAPFFLIGLLVPIREAGALLPQLALARIVQRSPERKWFWSAGSATQGVAAVGIALAAVTLEGAMLGWAVVACLALLSLARASSSVSYKDALARSIPKTRRGKVTGAAASLAAGGVLAFGALLSLGVIPLSVLAIAVAVAVAGAFWLLASVVFLLLAERGDEGDPNDPDEADLIQPLVLDHQLRRFIAARGFLTSTALAPPFILLLSATDGSRSLGELGPLVLASSAASILSGYLWGRLSDRSSRQTLMAAAALGTLALGAAAGAGLLLGGLGGFAGTALAIFALQIAYEGVRAGRKLHLTDMATDETRARYTAISNTLIGIVLVAGGAIGALADIAGAAASLALLALLCACGGVVAATLEEVQSADG